MADYALIPVDDVLLFWADEIVCMTEMQAVALSSRVKHTTVICLNIEDSFAYRDEELIKQIGIRYREESEKLKTA